MNSALKTWTQLGLAGVLAGGALAGCSGEAGEGESGEGGESAVAGEAGTGEGGESGEAGEAAGGEAGEAGALIGGDVEAMPMVNRLAFMAGHVEAGLALYRAGDAEAAASHLLHPVSETHAVEREGLEKMGFDKSLFEAVSASLEAGKPASEVEPQLKAAEANLAEVREKVGGEPKLIISFLMETMIREYAIAVKDGAVTDPGEYQDAYGFAVVARQVAADLEGDAAAKVGRELDQLIALFPEGGPIPPEKPAPVGQVSALASRVMLSLP